MNRGNSLLRLIRRHAKTPPHVLARKALRRLGMNLMHLWLRQQDRLHPTFLAETNKRPLELYMASFPPTLLRPLASMLSEVSEHYLAHRFDLLGSGWVRAAYGYRCLGVEGFRYDSGMVIHADSAGAWLSNRLNAANVSESQRVWRLVTPPYTPIDWQLDFKSGYRWRENTWYKDIEIPLDMPGADIKVPWELSRFQHLPQLALSFMLACDETKGFQTPEMYRREFSNQVLDFIATNPPRFGVNWHSTMDIAIRIVNWLVAYDLFRSAGAVFPAEFDAVFTRSVREHGKHIAENLEWFDRDRSNHYLANIVGLLFVAAYLAPDLQSNSWAGFSIGELIHEVREQFMDEGTNFEGSTSYHRLSAEMAVFGTAMALALVDRRGSDLGSIDIRFIPSVSSRRMPLPLVPEEISTDGLRLPEDYIDRLEKMGEFALHVTKGDGTVVQIGDNDSGRLLKLQPSYSILSVGDAVKKYINLNDYSGLPVEATFWDENALDHRHLLGALSAFFDREDFANTSGPFHLDREIIKRYSGGTRFCNAPLSSQTRKIAKINIGNRDKLERLKARLESSLPDENRLLYRFVLPSGELPDETESYAYPSFGLYILRNRLFFLSVRCRPPFMKGSGSHLHNDQLSVELTIGDWPIAVDPGSYLYTSLPDRRNEYRSTRAHYAPRISGREPADLTLGLFELRDRRGAQCLYFAKDGFAGMHEGFGESVYRLVEINGTELIISDYSEGEPLQPCEFEAKDGSMPRYIGLPLSPKYGCRLR